MALCGEGAVCIWNDISEGDLIEFYAWHNEEHMPERVGIPGFRRGRRYRAADTETTPLFFTLYETTTPEVTTGQDYLNRLNAPTPWTQRITQTFRNTFRALTRVKVSLGPGCGGALATFRMTLADEVRQEFERKLADDVLPELARMPLICGAHLCMTDMSASASRTAETHDRTDIMEPPNTSILIEGCNNEAVKSCRDALGASAVFANGQTSESGVYVLEYTRLKTAVAPG